MHKLCSNIVCVVVSLFLLILCNPQLMAQDNVKGILSLYQTRLSHFQSDTTALAKPNATVTNSLLTNKTKSTTTAMVLSAVMPGTGQLYNESYWKIPIILGLGGYWGYEWVQMNRELKTYQSKYSESLAGYPPFGNYQYKNLRDFYRSERDKFAWYLGLLYVLNIVDAYVDASLFEFNDDENLSCKTTSQNALAIKVKIYF
jgi:hypothetical protein